MLSRSTLRAQLRARRRALNPAQRRASALALARKLVAHPLFRRATRIACYFPMDGEMDTAPLLHRAWAMGKQVYLPILTASGALRFAPYVSGAKLRGNRFGIPEPVCHPRAQCSGRQLDLVLAPLVGFDRAGNRLGMGGGYYDRSFAYLLLHRHWRKPQLLGLAYEFQRVAKLTRNPWDVPLTGVVTEQHFHFARPPQ